MKNNVKGITLVSMVITIIVMLILAGVSISMVVGENGVLTRASSSSIKTNLASVAEDFNLAVSDLEMQYQDAWTDSSSIAAYKGIFVTIDKLNETLSQSKVLTANTLIGSAPTKKNNTDYVKNVTFTDKDLEALIKTDEMPFVQFATAETDLAKIKNPADYFVVYLSNGEDGTELGADVYAAVFEIESGIPKLIDIGLVEDAIDSKKLVHGVLTYDETNKKLESKSGAGQLPVAVTWLNEELGLESSTDEETE